MKELQGSISNFRACAPDYRASFDSRRYVAKVEGCIVSGFLFFPPLLVPLHLKKGFAMLGLRCKILVCVRCCLLVCFR